MATDSCREWIRPTSVPFPTVWRRCVGKTKNKDGKIQKFKIQDATEDMHEEIINLLSTIFIKDEHLCSSQNLVQDEVSVAEFQEVWRKYLKQNMALVILVDEECGGGNRARIAGFNVTCVSVKSDNETYDMYKGVSGRIIMKFILDYTLKNVNVFECYGVDAYLSALGLLILPEYRGQGLSVEILKARFDLARAVGLKATMTYFSPVAAQVAAKKAGMELMYEVLYDDYKEDGKIVFPNIETKSFK